MAKKRRLLKESTKRREAAKEFRPSAIWLQRLMDADRKLYEEITDEIREWCLNENNYRDDVATNMELSRSIVDVIAEHCPKVKVKIQAVRRTVYLMEQNKGQVV